MQAETWDITGGRWIDKTSGEVVEVKQTAPQRVLEQYGFSEPTSPFSSFSGEELEDPDYWSTENINANDGLDGILSEPAKQRSGYKIYFRGSAYDYGTDFAGIDVEINRKTGKARRIYSANTKKRIAEYARRYGNKRASVKFGVSIKSIAQWVNGRS